MTDPVNSKTQPLQAAGRAISGANASKLLTAHESLAQGVNTLKGILTNSGWMSAELPRAPFSGVQASALSVADETQARLWSTKVDTCLSICYRRLLGQDPTENLTETVTTTIAALRESIDSIPPSQARNWMYSDFDICWYGGDSMDPYGFSPESFIESVNVESLKYRITIAFRYFVWHFYDILNNREAPSEVMARLVDDFEAVLSEATSVFASRAPDSVEAATDSDPIAEGAIDPESAGEEIIEAAAGEYEATWDLTLAARAIDVDDDGVDDAVPIEGVLFRVDEPSECAPSVGPRLPLYITAEVASKALGHVLGRPLDAHESLEAHGGGIVGAITEGAVSGQDAIIRGFLHGYQLPEKVAEIRAAARSGELGMSMVGSVVWHRDKVDGRDVAVVDRMRLQGGTILRASVATYQKTRVKLMSAVDRQGRSLLSAVADSRSDPVEDLGDFSEPLAATAASPQPTQEDSTEPMTDSATPAATPVAASLPADVVDKFLSAIEALGARLSSLEEKQANREALEEEARMEAARQAEETARFEAVAHRVAEAIVPTIDDRISAILAAQRPTGPRRPTTASAAPLVTQTEVAASSANPQIQALLRQLEATPLQNTAARIALKDRISHIERNAALR